MGEFEAADLTGLPDPARRLISQALPEGVPLSGTALIDMEGEIKLKQWVPFKARQVFRAWSGFVWEANVGKAPVSFSGGDFYRNDDAALDFRLWGIFPVARGTGPDIARSARGRLAIEMVAWVPQSLLPGAGAIWSPIDDDRANVSVAIDGDRIDIEVVVGEDGSMLEATMMRWGNPDSQPFGEVPFGGAFDEWGTFDGVTIPTSGRVGWHWGTDRQSEGEFFRGRLLDVRYPIAPDITRG